MTSSSTFKSAREAESVFSVLLHRSPFLSRSGLRHRLKSRRWCVWSTRNVSRELGASLWVGLPSSSFLPHLLMCSRWRTDEAQKLLAGGSVEVLDSPKGDSALPEQKGASHATGQDYVPVCQAFCDL